MSIQYTTAKEANYLNKAAHLRRLLFNGKITKTEYEIRRATVNLNKKEDIMTTQNSLDKLIYEGDAVMLGKKNAVKVEDWKATLYNVKGRIIETDIDSEYQKGGEDDFVFYSTVLKKWFTVDTSGGGAEFVHRNSSVVKKTVVENDTAFPTTENRYGDHDAFNARKRESVKPFSF